MVTTTTTKRVMWRSEGSALQLWTTRGAPRWTLVLGAAPGARQEPLCPPLCVWLQWKQHHCRHLLLERQRAGKWVPCPPPPVLLPALTLLRNGNPSKCWSLGQQPCDCQQGLTHPGSVPPLQSRQAPATKLGTQWLCLWSLLLLRQPWENLTLPSPTQVLTCSSSQGCFLTSHLMLHSSRKIIWRRPRSAGG